MATRIGGGRGGTEDRGECAGGPFGIADQSSRLTELTRVSCMPARARAPAAHHFQRFIMNLGRCVALYNGVRAGGFAVTYM